MEIPAPTLSETTPVSPFHSILLEKRAVPRVSRGLVSLFGEAKMVIYATGYLVFEIEECGVFIPGLMWDQPPEDMKGLCVWEGAYHWENYGSREVGFEDGSWIPRGAHRALSEEEWALVRQGLPPWPPEDPVEA